MKAVSLNGGDAKMLVDLLPVGTVLCHNRIITNVNTAFAQMFGYEPHQLIGESLEILYPSRRDFIDRGEQWREFLASSGGHCDERTMVRRGNYPVHMRVRGRCRDQADPYMMVACAFEPVTPPQEPPVLSDREREIVNAMAEGMTSKEIARVLKLSHRTVETYRQRLMAKTRTRNAAQLLALLR